MVEPVSLRRVREVASQLIEKSGESWSVDGIAAEIRKNHVELLEAASEVLLDLGLKKAISPLGRRKLNGFFNESQLELAHDYPKLRKFITIPVYEGGKFKGVIEKELASSTIKEYELHVEWKRKKRTERHISTDDDEKFLARIKKRADGNMTVADAANLTKKAEDEES